jgi:hypothetical protein
MFIQTRFPDKVGPSCGFPGNDVCVPLVDKTIDVGSMEKKAAAAANSFGAKGENKFILQIGMLGTNLYLMSNIFVR